jgi:hypothetical protein
MERLFVTFTLGNITDLPRDDIAALSRLFGGPQFTALQELKFDMKSARGRETEDFKARVRQRVSKHAGAVRVCIV